MTDIDLHSIEERIAANVTSAYDAQDVPHYPYHNLAHSQEVVKRCQEIGGYYSIGAREMFTLVAAGWFHDIGHLYGPIEGHEERGVTIMQKYLGNVPRELTDEIAVCIMATKLPSHPVSLSEQIICDADTYHFGTPFFRETDPLVHREMELRKHVPPGHWSEKTLLLLQKHVFFTEYCKNFLAKGKEDNIRWAEAQIAASR